MHSTPCDEVTCASSQRVGWIAPGMAVNRRVAYRAATALLPDNRQHGSNAALSVRSIGETGRNFRMADHKETCYRPTTADHNTDLALRND